MQDLADRTNCSVALGTADRSAMVYLDVAQGEGPLILRLEVGSRIPMPVTAIGRAYLAALEGSSARRFCANCNATTATIGQS